MLFEEITREDLDELKELQPEGWSDISGDFVKYIERDFCNPIKVTLDGNIVGLGTSIAFEKTGWLAHIIVKEEFRNKGIGNKIVNFLISELKSKHIETFLLIATELGEPVYKKVGFKTISDYLFLKRKKCGTNHIEVSNKIKPYENYQFDEIIKLDKLISGENREQLIKYHLKDAMVYMENSEIHGVYLPDLGDGLIIADIPDAGIELMNLKYSKIDKAVIPAENKKGLEYLTQRGFKLSDSKGRKMILGNGISWKPDCYYSRIGGNYG